MKIITIGKDGVQEAVNPVVSSTGANDKGKPVGLDETGKLDPTVMPSGLGATTYVAPADEALSAGDFVNIFDDAGTTKVRLADAQSVTRLAHGFVKNSVAAGGNASVYLEGENDKLSGLTVGSEYFLDVNNKGKVVTNPYVTPGVVVQNLGFALSKTTILFERGKGIIIK
ncbi:hypothetical protein P4S95_23475 [Aneurinibacillus aneurinilyticus]|uniref:hypothetical protein n=1 Tax=Aneurinibacillus aneurinilyticus TaxID=1391 RepID=UPI002E218DFD|nr:hypothetical protein [Aneurinibacillus aneurinilyticus]